MRFVPPYPIPRTTTPPSGRAAGRPETATTRPWRNRRTAAPPVATFLAENDFGGKPIALFCTNGGGGLGHIPADVKALRRDAKLLDSLNLYEDGGAGAKAKIADWLKKNGLM